MMSTRALIDDIGLVPLGTESRGKCVRMEEIRGMMKAINMRAICHEQP